LAVPNDNLVCLHWKIEKGRENVGVVDQYKTDVRATIFLHGWMLAY